MRVFFSFFGSNFSIWKIYDAWTTNVVCVCVREAWRFGFAIWLTGREGSGRAWRGDEEIEIHHFHLAINYSTFRLCMIIVFHRFCFSGSFDCNFTRQMFAFVSFEHTHTQIHTVSSNWIMISWENQKHTLQLICISPVAHIYYTHTHAHSICNIIQSIWWAWIERVCVFYEKSNGFVTLFFSLRFDANERKRKEPATFHRCSVAAADSGKKKKTNTLRFKNNKILSHQVCLCVCMWPNIRFLVRFLAALF